MTFFPHQKIKRNKELKPGLQQSSTLPNTLFDFIHKFRMEYGPLLFKTQNTSPFSFQSKQPLKMEDECDLPLNNSMPPLLISTFSLSLTPHIVTHDQGIHIVCTNYLASQTPNAFGSLQSHHLPSSMALQIIKVKEMGFPLQISHHPKTLLGF